jgi:hypothetical protein
MKNAVSLVTEIKATEVFSTSCHIRRLNYKIERCQIEGGVPEKKVRSLRHKKVGPP